MTIALEGIFVVVILLAGMFLIGAVIDYVVARLLKKGPHEN